MPAQESRKEAIRKFKEIKPSPGIYAVRCAAKGSVWVGMAKNLEATRNRVWFSLRGGMHQDKLLQQEWNGQGEAAFQYEVLERLEDSVHPLELDDLLKRKKNDWMALLNARPLL